MVNYLTTKNRLLLAILAFILPFSFAKAEVKEVYSPALHGKRQGSICHDEKVAYRPFLYIPALRIFNLLQRKNII